MEAILSRIDKRVAEEVKEQKCHTDIAKGLLLAKQMVVDRIGEINEMFDEKTSDNWWNTLKPEEKSSILKGFGYTKEYDGQIRS